MFRGFFFLVEMVFFFFMELMGVNENVGGLILALSFSERGGWLMASSPFGVGLQFVFTSSAYLYPV